MTRRALLSLATIAVVAAVAHAMMLSRATPPVSPLPKGAAAPWGTVTGPARVIDGDTVEVAGVRVRLKGVDAAELRTPRGEEARRVMIGIVGNASLTCRLTGEKTYSREVGWCVTAGGVD